MATQAFVPIQDQNSSVHYRGASIGGKPNASKAPIGGKPNASKTLKKGGVSGRKPLGDLSNAVMLASAQTSKKLNTNVVSFTEKEPTFSRVTTGVSKKKNVSNASEKKVQVSGRKALSDISNSGKPHFLETSKKNLKASTKLSAVTEEPIRHVTLADECFLHNHQECIKGLKKPVDVDEFLKIVGLDKGFSHTSSSPWPSTPKITQVKTKTSLKAMDLEEMAEHLLIEADDSLSSHELELSPACKTLKSLDQDFGWNNDDDGIDFNLMESPVSIKL